MENVDLLIFDLDGTIADTQNDLAAAVNHVRAVYGKAPIDLATLRSFIGNGIISLIERALPDLSAAEMDRAIKGFRTYYRAHLMTTTKLYPGMCSILERYAGVKKVVLTNKNESLSRELLKGLGILDCFRMVWGGDTGPRKKPDPEPILQILSRLKTARGKAIMIGDGPNDILAARNAGIRCVAVTYGYSGREELSKLKADYMIDSIEELAGIIC